MVSKLIVAGTLFIGAVFADVDLKVEDFESAICKESYTEHKDKGKLNLEDLVKTHGCPDKHLNLCAIHVGDDQYLTCSSNKHEHFTEKKFKGEKFNIATNEIDVTKVKEIECKEVTNKYDRKFKEALLAMHGKKDTFKALEEVKGDHTHCIVVIEEEAKKEGDKKEDGEKKEIKKISKVYWFTVHKKDYKPTEKVEELTILEKKYKGLHCGTKENLEKEAKAFETAEASGCCSCAWYVWVIVAVVIVGAGVGAYFVLKEDKDEDEYEAEYGTA